MPAAILNLVVEEEFRPPRSVSCIYVDDGMILMVIPSNFDSCDKVGLSVLVAGLTLSHFFQLGQVTGGEKRKDPNPGII